MSMRLEEARTKPVDRVIRIASVVFLALLTAGGASAGSLTARAYAFERLKDANDLIAEGDFELARTKLMQVSNWSKVNDYERAMANQALGFLYFAAGEYAEAARSFEGVKRGILDEVAELNMLYNLAQLYVALDRPREAIEIYQQWFDKTTNPSAQSYIAYANAWLQLDDYARALPLVEKGVSRAKVPEESWLKLLLALYFETQQYPKAAGVLKQLLHRYPAKDYWIQLAAVHGEMNDYRASMTTLELAHKQGYLTEEVEFVRLAHLFLHFDVPYKAARILRDGMERGFVPESEHTYRLLAESLLQAREIDGAMAPLMRAAELSKEGDLYLRLAQIHVGRHEWDEARQAVAAAFEKSDLADPGTAYLLEGIALVSLGELDRAREALGKARKHKDTRRIASEHLAYIDTLEDRQGLPASIP